MIESTVIIIPLILIDFIAILVMGTLVLYIKKVESLSLERESRMQENSDRMLNLLLSKDMIEYKTLQGEEIKQRHKKTRKDIIKEQMEEAGVYKEGDKLEYNFVE